MTKRTLFTNSSHQTSLENSLNQSHNDYLDSLVIVHLVKFEKPKSMSEPGTQDADRYIYLTDNAYDIDFQDEVLGPDGVRHASSTYIANKILSMGTVNENIQAKASSLTLKLDATSLGASVTVGKGTFTGPSTFDTTLFNSAATAASEQTNFLDAGFREGDNITFGNVPQPLTITSFIKDGLGFTFQSNANSANFAGNYAQRSGDVVTLAAEELNAILTQKDSSYTNYINRDVFIYRAHINPETRLVVGEPFLYFKGIVTSGSIDEKLTGTTITWSLASHWGNFLEVRTRFADDNTHRALNSRGQSDTSTLIRQAYKSDLGFMHSNTSIYQNIKYMGTSTQWYEGSDSSVLGWGTGPILEREVPVERNTFLNITMNSKSIPVVYGTRKVRSWPVFVDTDSTDSKDVYKIDAICEGEITSILDIQVEGSSVTCNDLKDQAVRGIDPATDLPRYEEDAVPSQVCFGNKRRGDVIGKSTFNQVVYQCYTEGGGNTPHTVAQYSYLGVSDHLYDLEQVYECVPKGLVAGGVEPFGTTAVGLQHDDYYVVPKPSTMTCEMQVHLGKAEQKADPRFVGVANDQQFSIQKNYYDNAYQSLPYWSSSHKLLDTAYVSSKITIGDGETTIPNLEFVIKGRQIDCHNYDNSFTVPAYLTTGASEADLAHFSEGSVVKIKYLGNQGPGDEGQGVISSNDVVTVNDVTILHVFTSLEASFNHETRNVKRFVLDTDTDFSSIAYFWLEKDVVINSNNVTKTLQLENSGKNLSGSSTLPAKVTAKIASTSAGTNMGKKFALTNLDDSTFSSVEAQPWAEFAQDANRTKTYVGKIRLFTGTGASESGRNFVSTYTWDSSTNSIDDVHVGVDGTFTRVEFINVIPTNSGTGRDFSSNYKNCLVDFTRSSVNSDNENVEEVQTRTIVDATTSRTVLLVDSPWDGTVPGTIPNTSNESYQIRTPKDRRGSLNPAMQLLDYMTNDRFGRGLDIDRDIDLESFKQAARDCDTRSDVTIFVTTGIENSDTTTWVVGEKWRYPKEFNHSTTAPRQWQGVVKSKGPIRVINNITGRFITFEKCSGKFGHKWNDYTQYYTGQLYWYNGYLFEGTNAVQATPPAVDHSYRVTSNIQIGKGSGSTLNYATVNIQFAAADGNPIVKDYDEITNSFQKSGYSLYDSDNVDYWRYHGWDENTQYSVTRHQFNQIVNTKAPLFDNINKMLQEFNGILRYSAGKYSLQVMGKKATVDTIEQINDDDIIGTIKISDKGLKKSKNYMTASIIDPGTNFESRSVTFFNSEFVKEDKGIQKSGNVAQNAVTNYYNARMNVEQALKKSRYGLELQFTMIPKGLLLTAGSIIEVTNERFGFVGREFRITNLNFQKDGLVDVTAEEHDDSIYDVSEPVFQETGTSGKDTDPELQVPVGPSNFKNNPGVINTSGFVNLVWTNTSQWSSATHLTEIIRSESSDYNATTNAGSFVIGNFYTIKEVGSSATDFTDIGAPDNNPGTVFMATGVGSGNGKVFNRVLAGVSDSDHFQDEIRTGIGGGSQETRYYWARYRVKKPLFHVSGANFRNSFSSTTPATSATGVVAIAYPRNFLKAVQLSAVTRDFSYDSDGTIGSTTTSVITASDIHMSGGTKAYVWKVDGVTQAGETSATFTYTAQTNLVNMPQVVTCEVTHTVADASETISDSITLTGVRVNALAGSLIDDGSISETELNTSTNDSLNLADSASQVNVGLALITNKHKNSDNSLVTNNGDAILVGVDKNGTPIVTQDGFIQWEGSKITIETNQYNSGGNNILTILTGSPGRKGFIIFDTAKGNPFTVHGGGIDVAFAWKIGTQWYYDNNGDNAGTTFTPAASYVAIGYLETTTSDLITKGGLFGHPVPVDQAAFPGDEQISGTVGGWTIDSDAIFSGTKDTSGYNGENALTISSAGSLHAKEFYIDTDGGAHFAGEITIGTSDSVFKADATSGIHLGAAAFDGAPFSVSMGGSLIARDADFAGTIRASALLLDDNAIIQNNVATSVADSSITLDSLNNDVIAYIDTQASGYAQATAGDNRTSTNNIDKDTTEDTAFQTFSNFDHGINNPTVSTSVTSFMYLPDFHQNAGDLNVEFKIYARTSYISNPVTAAGSWTLIRTISKSATSQVIPQNPAFTRYLHTLSFVDQFVHSISSDDDGKQFDYKIELSHAPEYADNDIGVFFGVQEVGTAGSINASTLNALGSSDFMRSTADTETTEYIKHAGDTDTHLRFETDKITLTAGSHSMITMDGLVGADLITLHENVQADGDLTVTGNLNITGDINSYNVTDLDVTDKTITVGSGQIAENSGSSGLIVDRGDSTDASILWNQTNSNFDITEGVHITKTILADQIYYPLQITATDTDSNVVDQTGDSGVGIKFRIAGDDATPLVGASIAAMRESDTDANKSTGLAFFTSQNDEVLDEALRISHEGKVGIGTDTPANKLEVTGGTIIANGGGTFDPAGDGPDTSATVAIAIPSGQRIIGSYNGYIRNLIDFTQSQPIIIGQTGTTLLRGVELHCGNAYGVKIKNSDSSATLTINEDSHISTKSTSVSGTSAIVIDSFAHATYRSAKYTIQITQGTKYQTSDIMVIHDGSTPIATEYAMLETNGVLGTFDVAISGDNVELKVTMAAADESTVRAVRHSIRV